MAHILEQGEVDVVTQLRTNDRGACERQWQGILDYLLGRGIELEDFVPYKFRDVHEAVGRYEDPERQCSWCGNVVGREILGVEVESIFLRVNQRYFALVI